MVWSSHLFLNFPQFIVIHTVKGFGIVSKAEIDVFLELSCFFNDPVDVGNLISGSSAFSKSSLNIWKFARFSSINVTLVNMSDRVVEVCYIWGFDVLVELITETFPTIIVYLSFSPSFIYFCLMYFGVI